MLTVQDDDVAAIELSPRNLMLGEGEQGSYSVRLATEPAGDVLVELMPGDGRGRGADGLHHRGVGHGLSALHRGQLG